jgi:hypothetical protein
MTPPDLSTTKSAVNGVTHPPIDRSNHLGDLAARIIEEHAQVNLAVRNALARAMNAGDMLAEAKERVGHGRWESWLKKTCNIPPRTASRYILLAENRGLIEANSATVADLTVRGALRLLRPKPKPKTTLHKKRPPFATALSTLAWSDASPDARARFIDGVGVRSIWDAMTPSQRAAIVNYALALTPTDAEVIDVATA